ncbi:MAG: isoprenylcysteine carboxylmethyltransferase family protein [Chitinophagales bacterium]|nr:isoprenylcysteine carboxylmethyltransferase family protein [Chitinophagales bacterium]
METTTQHAGVYIPPPILGLGVFLLSIFLQKNFPINQEIFNHSIFHFMGYVFVIISFIFGIPGVYRFRKTGNTIETFKAATSLQTTGMYAISRNPMYVGLVCMYFGISLLIKSNWAVLLVILFIALLRYYVIRREENYLKHAFGEEYLQYLNKVNRWIGKKQDV